MSTDANSFSGEEENDEGQTEDSPSAPTKRTAKSSEEVPADLVEKGLTMGRP